MCKQVRPACRQGFSLNRSSEVVCQPARTRRPASAEVSGQASRVTEDLRGKNHDGLRGRTDATAPVTGEPSNEAATAPVGADRAAQMDVEGEDGPGGESSAAAEPEAECF